MSDYHFEPIGFIKSPFRDKFGIPRQSGLAPAVTCRLQLDRTRVSAHALRGLEDFSHLWLVFIFHQATRTSQRDMVRPPRLGGNRKLGVFATRSPFRPNAIGLSCVRLLSWHETAGELSLQLSGADLVDGTPVLDIKPYLPYTDALPHAQAGFAEEAPAPLPVTFTETACEAMQSLQTAPQALRQEIEQVLSLDPRPAYHRDSTRTYHLRLHDLDISFHVEKTTVTVTDLRVINCEDDARRNS